MAFSCRALRDKRHYKSIKSNDSTQSINQHKGHKMAKKTSISIIGGSIAGLTSALIFASAKSADKDFEITIIDEGKADLNAAAIYNAPLFPQGAKASEIYSQLKSQIASMLEVRYITGKATEVSGQKGEFTTSGEGFSPIKSEYVIFATGASAFEIAGFTEFVRPHSLIPRPNKVRLEWSGRQELKAGAYVAGIASGVTSMVTTAMGSASEAACAILSDIAGEVAYHHDTPTSRK